MFRSATKIHDDESYLFLVRCVVLKILPQGLAKLLHANFTGLTYRQNVNRKSYALQRCTLLSRSSIGCPRQALAAPGKLWLPQALAAPGTG